MKHKQFIDMQNFFFHVCFSINFKSFLHLRKKGNESIELQCGRDCSSSTGSQTPHEKKKEAAKTLLIIAFFYSLCMSAYPFYIIFSFIVRRDFIASGTNLMNFSYSLIAVNGGINSFIYILRSQNIRRYLSKTILCKYWYRKEYVENYK